MSASPEEISIMVEIYILENRIDEKASNTLKGCPIDVQQLVMEEGNLEKASNPSKECMYRIRKAEQKVKQPAKDKVGEQGGGKEDEQAGGKEGEPTAKRMKVEITGEIAGEVELFILENSTDEKASDYLRSSSNEVQKRVLEEGPLTGKSNPSAALMFRINQAKKELGGGKGGGGWQKKGGNGGGGVASNSDLQTQLAALLGGGCGGGSAGGGKASDPVLQTQVDAFLEGSGVDEETIADFQQCSDDVKRICMEGGGFQDARNPSGALIGRIKRARTQLGETKGGDKGWKKKKSGKGGGGGGGGDDAIAGILQALLPALTGGGDGGKGGGKAWGGNDGDWGGKGEGGGEAWGGNDGDWDGDWDGKGKGYQKGSKRKWWN